MSETVKLIIEIPKKAKQAFNTAESNLKGGFYDHGGVIGKAIQNGIPLDDVKAEIEANMYCDKDTRLVKNANASGLEEALEILDNIGKGDKE